MLEKLPSVLVRINCTKFALEKSDEIFKIINVEEFKEKLTTVNNMTL